MKKILTEEQKQKRAETARQNGSKSKGPVTVEGKNRSSMNAITVGKYVDVHDEDLPAFATLLSVDDRKAYVRLHQANLRKFRPDSEQEHQLLRHMLQFQVEHDKLLREWPEVPDEHFSYYAVQRAADDDKVYRFLARKKKEHLAAWIKLQRLFAQNRKDFPVNPPEPVDITADSGLINQPDPPPYVIEELLKIADQAKKEPTAVLPCFVIELIHEKELMRKYAPDYDYADLRERYPLPKPRLAA
ncbi:MAG: hypothetical protein NTX13_08130 [Acidobacteria bacterium]|nr:hypothetical protein [Acidobacteriota bacterium]